MLARAIFEAITTEEILEDTNYILTSLYLQLLAHTVSAQTGYLVDQMKERQFHIM